MSFSSMTAPAMRLGGQILRGSTLKAMGRTVGLVGAAGAMAAVYQVSATEMQRTMDAIRARGTLRRNRHEAIQIQILGTTLSASAQTKVLSARDAYKACLALLVDPRTLELDRDSIRQALLSATNSHPG